MLLRITTLLQNWGNNEATLKLGIPLRVCALCGKKLQEFSKFKHVCIESSQRYEQDVKDKDNIIPVCASLNTQLQTNCASVEDHVTSVTCAEDTPPFEVFIKDEPFQDTPNDFEYNSILQTVTNRDKAVDYSDSFSNIKKKSTDDSLVHNNQTNVDVKVKEEEIDIKVETTSNEIIVNDGVENNETTVSIKAENIIHGNITNEENIENNTVHKDLNNFSFENSDKTEKLPENDFKEKETSNSQNYKQGNLSNGFATVGNNLKMDDINNSQNCTQVNSSKDDVLVGSIIKISKMVVIYRCPNCNKLLDSLELLDSHKNLCKSECKIQNEVYICSKCKKKFPSYGTLAKHLEVCPNPIINVKCNICNKMFNSINRMTNHKTKVHKSELNPGGMVVYQCTTCNAILPTQDILHKHKKSCQKLDYPCIKCNKEFHSYGSLAAHLEVCPKINTNVMCEICNVKFNNLENLLNHKNKVHAQKNNPLQCSKCNVTLPTKILLDHHKKACASKKRFYQCYKCDQIFYYYKSFSKHAEVCRDMNIICNICNNVFQSINSLNNHKIIFHNAGKTVEAAVNDVVYKCSICNILLPSQIQLDQHKKNCVISKNLDYPCYKCNKILLSFKTLQEHMEDCPKNNVTYNIKCDNCNKKFLSISSMLLHKTRVHNAVKNHKCDKCENSYVSLNQLLNHEKKHNGVVCVICNKPFLNKYTLKKHMNRHYEVKEFQCSICEKQFYTNLEVQDHEKKKHGIKNIICYVCRKEFLNEEDLAEHLKTHENTEILQLAMKGLL